MEIDIRIPGDGAFRTLRSYIETRLNEVLDRFAGRLGAVKVFIGSDQSCEIQVQLLPSGIWIKQESRNADLRELVDHAVNRISAALSKTMKLPTPIPAA